MHISLVLHLLWQKCFIVFFELSNRFVSRACVAICKVNSNLKSNLVLKDHSKFHLLPVSVKPAIPMSVSTFCVSPTRSNSSDVTVQKLSFDSYSFKSSSFTNSASQSSFCHSKFSNPKITTTPKSSISVSPTNRNSFSLSPPSVIKSIMNQNLFVRLLKHLIVRLFI